MFPVASNVINCHPAIVAVQVHSRSLSHPRQTLFPGYSIKQGDVRRKTLKDSPESIIPAQQHTLKIQLLSDHSLEKAG